MSAQYYSLPELWRGIEFLRAEVSHLAYYITHAT